MVIPDSVKAAYSEMRKIERQIGGDGGGAGMYGSLSEGGMQPIITYFKLHGMGRESVFVDVGTGLGRPLVHAMVDAHVHTAYGYELAEEKCRNAREMMRRLHQRGILSERQYRSIHLRCMDVARLHQLPPGTTHVYAFWQGFHPEDKMAFGRLFSECDTARSICVVNNVTAGWSRPEQQMAEYEFGTLRLDMRRRVNAQGGSSFTAFVFSKV
jgi:hypothetical protein